MATLNEQRYQNIWKTSEWLNWGSSEKYKVSFTTACLGKRLK